MKRALLIPKLRRQLAEFLNRISLVHLRFLTPSTCVGLRYGPIVNSRTRLFLAACLRPVGLPEGSLPCHVSELRPDGFAYPVLLLASTTISNRWLAFTSASPLTVKRAQPGAGIFDLLSITYAFRPRLRDRLTPGRLTLPGKP